MSKKVYISPKVSIYVNDAMLEMLNIVSNAGSMSLNLATAEQKNLLKQMHERNLLFRRRKNNEVSYSVRPGINWN